MLLSSAVLSGCSATRGGAGPAGEAVRRRGAAQRLRGDGIRVNAINADQIDTPLFRQFVRERAAGRGVSDEAQLEGYCYVGDRLGRDEPYCWRVSGSATPLATSGRSPVGCLRRIRDEESRAAPPSGGAA